MQMEDTLQKRVYVNHSVLSNNRKRIKKQWWTDKLIQVWDSDLDRGGQAPHPGKWIG